VIDYLALAAGAAALMAVVLLVGRRPPVPLRSLLGDRPAASRPSSRPVSTAIGAVGDLMAAAGKLIRRLARLAPDPAADRRVGVAVLLGVSGSFIHPLVGAGLAGIPAVARFVRENRERQRARAALVEDVPDLVDLFRVAAGGGFTVHQAVDAVASVVADPFSTALRDLQRRVSVGERLSDALAVLGAMGDPVRPLVSALVSAERDGASLTVPLQRASDQARELRRRQAEEAARRVPVKLLFPLVLCVLPAFALLAVVPLLAGTLRSFAL